MSMRGWATRRWRATNAQPAQADKTSRPTVISAGRDRPEAVDIPSSKAVAATASNPTPHQSSPVAGLRSLVRGRRK